MRTTPDAGSPESASTLSARLDLSQYRLVIVPTLYSAAADIVASVDTYVRNGGHALVTSFLGIVNGQGRDSWWLSRRVS